MNATAAVGLTIMIVSEAATILGIEPFHSWNTPICWTGFILFADAIVWRARGDSWLRSAPAEFAALALLSIPLWLVFEGYNLIINNWYYTGVPSNAALRNVGYAWSFATIWPAIFEGADLVDVWRSGGGARASGVAASGNENRAGRAGDAARGKWSRASTMSVAAGTLMVACPFFAAPGTARYLAAPVWLGFIFLLDPINAVLGAQSLIGDWQAGRTRRLTNLVLSGFLCGVLWEFWNYWAGAKWHYSVPIMEHVKIFEMPLPGYFGFPAFAIECFTMYVFVRAMWNRLTHHDAARGREVAL
jgi:hypothetical protein